MTSDTGLNDTKSEINTDVLIEMARKSGVKGIDETVFQKIDQVKAYQYCCDFVSALEKSKTMNTRRNSNRYKHLVENPSRIDGLIRQECYTTYVYEGTFILAAIANGFTWKQSGNFLKVYFNIGERSLTATLKRLAASQPK